MQQKLTRFISFFMSVIMVCGLLPTRASAAAAPGSVWPNGILWSNNGNWFTSTDPQTGATKYNQNIESYVVIGEDGSTQYPVYCIQPGIEVLSSSTEGCTSATVATSDAWAGLSQEKRDAIGLAMLYGYPNNLNSESYLERRGMQFATQVIIWEIVVGYRNATAPFTRTNANYVNMFYPDSTGNVFTDSLTGANNGTITNFHAAYNEIANKLATHYVIPSFASRYASMASTYDMTYSNGVYSWTGTDTNNVLSNCTFTSGDGVTYTVNGNQLTVTSTKPLDGVTAAASKNVPNVESQSFVFYTKPGYQSMITMTGNQTEDPVPVYFKLNAEAVAGNIKFTKNTNTGSGLSGWKINLYSDSACTKLVDTYTTGSDGTVTTGDLMPGTYYAKEVNESGTYPYWGYDSSTKTITVKAGSTATATFNNTHYGKIKITKNTNTGQNRGGWEFNVYSDAACTKLVTNVTSQSWVEGGDNTNYGTVTTDNLLPGTYYVKEIPWGDNEYWGCDTEVKTVTVAAGKTATATFSNTHYGKIKITKTTNTGEDLADWVFEIKNSDGDVVDTITTDAKGVAASKNLLPGTYTVTERAPDDGYWVSDTTAKSVNVIAGSTASVSVTNTHYGKIQITKETINTDAVDGWIFSVYSDSACTKLVGTFTSGTDGTVTTGNLLPGTYYVKETGDENGRWGDEYWVCDTDVEAVSVTAGTTSSVAFTNIQYGKIHVAKTVDTDGPVNGWQFRITDKTGKEIIGSPFITDKNGEILTDVLAPGEYTVEEIIPEHSLYYNKSGNPISVTVAAGEAVEASFTNALRPGKITINKVDTSGNPLAGAKFCLEWSKDGTTWTPVHYSATEDVVLGGSSNAEIVDGCLVTGDDGIIEWANLYPGIQYRVTEVEAPDGYNLLSKAAYEGELPIDDLTVSLRVVNTQVMVLPQTGAADFNWMPICLGICLSICTGAVLYLLYKKEEEA